MTTAREVMMSGVKCIRENESLEQAARLMRDLDVGSLPICGEDERLKGMITDRDIVVKCIAEGMDARNTMASTLAQGKPVTIAADDTVEHALQTMKAHQIRRLPVIDDHKLVGIISQGDIAKTLSHEMAGALVEEISQHN